MSDAAARERAATLVVDIGKSATRAEIRSSAPPLVGASSGLPPDTAARASCVRLVANAVRAAFCSAAASAGEPVWITSVGISTTVLPADPRVRRQIAAAILECWPDATVALADDVVCAHAGAMRGVGVVGVAGTGAVVAGLGTDGTWLRADGWGPLLGDRGSAYAIGRAGLRSAFEACDADRASELRERATHRLGGCDLGVAQRLLGWPDVIADVAAFARDVVSAAADGDDEALSIVRAAADELAATAAAVSLRLSTTDVCVVGGLTAEPLWSALVRDALRLYGLVSCAPAGSILDGAARILDDPSYTPHVLTVRGATA